MKTILDNRENRFIIAEAGVNHNGDKKMAFDLIDVASQAGADAIKFQTFSADKLAGPEAQKAEYQKGTTSQHESQVEMLRKLELPKCWHAELQNYATEKGLIFISTPFHVEAVDLLSELSVPFFKVSSADIDNLPLLRHIAQKKIPVLLSTGMANLPEIREAIDTLHTGGCPEWGLLHCLSQYPAPSDEANLLAIQTLADTFSCPVGYSDHTQGNETAIAATALGAQIFEKHITLNKTLHGPDHLASACPAEFFDYVSSIRATERALGDGVKVCQPCELDTKIVARKSVVAIRNLPAGHVLRAADLTVLRPALGIAPKYLTDLPGRKLTTSVKSGQCITWELVS